jgi:hypothetical protein
LFRQLRFKRAEQLVSPEARSMLSAETSKDESIRSAKQKAASIRQISVAVRQKMFSGAPLHCRFFEHEDNGIQPFGDDAGRLPHGSNREF